MLKKILSQLIMKYKGREVTLDENLTGRDILFLIFSNAYKILKGWLILNKSVALGSNVKIVSRRNLHIYRGVSIGDYSYLNSVSKRGLTIRESSSIGSFSILKVSGSFLSLGDYIDIGKNVGIGDFAHIGGAGGVTIGDDTIAGAYLSIHPENHVFTGTKELIRNQGVTRKGIEIGKNCWIGAKVTILDGAKVGDGCVIAAGAVVNSEFPDNVVIGGVPAKILKER